MKTIVNIYVHNGAYYSFCGKDYDGYKEFKDEKEAMNFINENNFSVNETYSDNELNIKIINLKTIEFYHNLEKIKQLFIEGSHKLVDEYWDKQNKLENEERKKQGYIRCKEYEDMTAEDFKGSLNKSLTKDVLEYIATGRGIWGYMGHSARTYNHDKVVEEIVENINLTLDNKELDKWKALGSWLTSTSARHFMDSVEDEDIETFKKEFSSNLFDILFEGFLFNLPEHHGTYDDTIRLSKIYKDRVKIANE